MRRIPAPTRSILRLLARVTGSLLLALAGGQFFTVSAAPLLATNPSLGTAANFSILAGSAVTNTGASTVSHDVGIYPGIGSPPHVTGFGTVTLGGTLHDADATAQTAQADAAAAFTALGSQTCSTDYGNVTHELAGNILVPGVYCAKSFHLSSGTLTLNGTASDVWIFKSASDLIITGSPALVVFSGGGQPCNVWWRVVSTATLGAGSAFVGTILADTSITLAAGASLDGRALARTAEVTLSSNSITGPTCAAAGTATPTRTTTATVTRTATSTGTTTTTATATGTQPAPATATNTQAPVIVNTPIPAPTLTPLPAPTETATAPAVVALPATGGGPLPRADTTWVWLVALGSLGLLAAGLTVRARRRGR